MKGRHADDRFWETTAPLLFSERRWTAAPEEVGFNGVELFGNLEGEPYDHNARRLVALAQKWGVSGGETESPEGRAGRAAGGAHPEPLTTRQAVGYHLSQTGHKPGLKGGGNEGQLVGRG